MMGGSGGNFSPSMSRSFWLGAISQSIVWRLVNNMTSKPKVSPPFSKGGEGGDYE
jgi:arginine exporter protein ArgO